MTACRSRTKQTAREPVLNNEYATPSVLFSLSTADYRAMQLVMDFWHEPRAVERRYGGRAALSLVGAAGRRAGGPATAWPAESGQVRSRCRSTVAHLLSGPTPSSGSGRPPPRPCLPARCIRPSSRGSAGTDTVTGRLRKERQVNGVVDSLHTGPGTELRGLVAPRA